MRLVEFQFPFLPLLSLLFLLPQMWISSWPRLVSRTVRNKLCSGILFSPPLRVKKAVLSLNRAALSPEQDTNAAVVPGQQQTTVTPRPPTCRFVPRRSQWYPPPAPVVTCPSPQDFPNRHDVYLHIEWIKVRKVCVVQSHSLFSHRRSSTGTEAETCGPESVSAAG